jgi:hypothetical protein
MTLTVHTLAPNGVSALPHSTGGMTMLTAFQMETENTLGQHTFPTSFIIKDDKFIRAFFTRVQG